MWSVLTMPCLVLTVEPSIRGSRSRCTPSRDTSAPAPSERLATLSSSSIKTMPFCSASARAFCLSSSSFTSFAASSSHSASKAALTDILRVLLCCWDILENILCSWLVISSMPGGAMISMLGRLVLSSTSTSLSARSPSRNFLRSSCRVLEEESKAASRAGGNRISRIRSSAASSARKRTRVISCSRYILIATSTRSRTIDSTSRPT